jgi:hypothetical protein
MSKPELIVPQLVGKTIQKIEKVDDGLIHIHTKHHIFAVLSTGGPSLATYLRTRDPKPDPIVVTGKKSGI